MAEGSIQGFQQAAACVQQHAARAGASGVARIALEQALGRVLAEDVRADRDFPPFNRSTRDGFALKAGSAKSYAVVGEARAGESWRGQAVGAGTCVAIMTGAPLPEGADAVLMLEHAEQRGQNITVAAGRSVRSGENVVARGSEAREGSVVVASGTRMTAAHIGMAAACGRATLSVRARPSVAVMATGDELVEVEQQLGPEQIRNSNGPALAAAARRAGAEPVRVPVAQDTAADVQRRLTEAFEHDLVLIAGGVSAGKYDLVERVLAENFAAEFFFTGVRMQPGRPVVFGKARGKYFFGLPGNPVSALVTFGLLARPLLAALCGERFWQPRYCRAQLEHGMPPAGELTRFLPAWLSSSMDRPTVRAVPWHGSGDMAALAGANAFLVLPEGGQELVAGAYATVWLAD